MVLLSPSIDCNIVIQHKQPIVFYCIATEYDCVELWSNLTRSKEWASFSFKKQKEGYQLVIHTYNLPPDIYEFTLRYKKQTDTQWSWYGKLGQNGYIRLAQDHLSNKCLPRLDWVASDSSRGIHLEHFSAPIREEHGQMHLGEIGAMHSYVSYLRKG